jgi:hypothetical protein
MAVPFALSRAPLGAAVDANIVATTLVLDFRVDAEQSKHLAN